MNNEKAKLLLTAAILNNKRQVEIFGWLALVAPDYGTKPFNKRFETWLNKLSSERFGTKTIENWGMNGESKTYPKVTFYLRKEDYQYGDGDDTRFGFNIHYDGKTVRRSFDNKTETIEDSNESEKIFSVTDIAGIVEHSQHIAQFRQHDIDKMEDNMAHLAELEIERAEVNAKLKAYNDKLSYAISDQMRIK